MNIPIYRAERLDGLGNIEGYLIKQDDSEQLAIVSGFNLSIIYVLVCPHNIDPTTLAIHFPDMLDSKGNKIFASLSEDGKGGDIVEHEQVLGGILKSSGPKECIIKYCNRDHIIAPFFINAKYKNQKTYMTKEHLLVIGIQE